MFYITQVSSIAILIAFHFYNFLTIDILCPTRRIMLVLYYFSSYNCLCKKSICIPFKVGNSINVTYTVSLSARIEQMKILTDRSFFFNSVKLISAYCNRFCKNFTVIFQYFVKIHEDFEMVKPADFYTHRSISFRSLSDTIIDL